MDTSYPYSVQVLMATKSYSSKPVLRKLSMHVPQGTIYGLLGPSGCGKTTLLNALIGQIKLDSGQIKMLTSDKSEIGYMPQTITLYDGLSIEEHLNYYGRLYALKSECITKRAEEITSFLQLPPLNCVINKMSGGQQRRVSLCIALFHNPELLILDEPTVGVDVILANSIWEKLIHMSQYEGKTIIVTTHYIEEARLSNTIGLMRKGTILAEASPNSLMEQQECDTLEHAFLKLCEKHGNSPENDEDEGCENNELIVEQKNHLKRTKAVTIHRIYAHILKNIYWMKRNIPIMLFTFALPIIQCCLVSVTFGEKPSGLSLAIVNDEMTEGFHECLSHKWLGPVNCNGQGIPFSCYIMQKLANNSIKINVFKDVNDAKRSVKKNNNWGFMYFNKFFTFALRKRITSVLSLNNDTILSFSEINVWLDTTNNVISSSLKNDIIRSSLDFIYESCERCKWSPYGAALPIKYEKPVFGTHNPSIRQYMTPANAVLFEFYFPVLFTVSVLIDEKTSGLLDRSIIAGLSIIEIVMGHIVMQYAVLFVQTLLEWVILFIFFDNPIIGSFISCFLLLLLIGTCGMFYGFLIVCQSKSFTSAAVITFGGYFPLFMLSGALWPIEGMHYVLRVIASCLPVTRSVEAFRSLSVRGWPLSHPAVYSSFIAIVLWSALFIVLSSIFIKFKGLTR